MADEESFSPIALGRNLTSWAGEESAAERTVLTDEENSWAGAASLSSLG